MSASPQSPRVLELPYRWAGRDGSVRAEIRENDDPVALGCPRFAYGFPYCYATVDPPRKGYADFLGWVQLADPHYPDGGFEFDPFMAIGSASYPFVFPGWSPTLFDAPHTDEEWNFLAHSFLCGLGGDLHDVRREVRAVLGFSWGFSNQGPEIEFFGPDPLKAADWDGHRDHLEETFPEWTFAPGFHQHSLP